MREENAAAALEVMSRFAVDPQLLAYLPPTMAPTATSHEDGFLEHPAEAFAQYAGDGVERVVCEEKHMGSRAVALVCKDAGAATARFGTAGPTGALYTRTGRPFLDDAAMTEAVLDRLRTAVTAAGLWQEWDTDWVLLDAELMPWSLKAGGLLRSQYAAVGAASGAVFPSAVAALEQAVARGVEVAGLAGHQRARAQDAAAFTEAYRRYCWPTDGLDGVRLAPFQILAVQGRSLASVPHDEQLAWLDRLVEHDPTGLLQVTRRLVVDTGDEASVRAGVDWWLEMTGRGGEGMVVKPLGALVRDAGAGSSSPASRCAAGSTSASSTAPSTPARRIWSACAPGSSATSGRWRCGSTHSVWRPWTGWRRANRCGGSTRRCSRFWRWSRSRWTPALRAGQPVGDSRGERRSAR